MEILIPLIFIIFGALLYGYQYNRIIRENKDLKDSLETMTEWHLFQLTHDNEMLELCKKSLPDWRAAQLIQFIHERYTGEKLRKNYAKRLLKEFREQYRV